MYQCPLGLSFHNGNAENGDKYVEQDVLRTLIVSKRVIFNNMEFVDKSNQPRDIILTDHRADNPD